MLQLHRCGSLMISGLLAHPLPPTCPTPFLGSKTAISVKTLAADATEVFFAPKTTAGDKSEKVKHQRRIFFYSGARPVFVKEEPLTEACKLMQTLTRFKRDR